MFSSFLVGITDHLHGLSNDDLLMLKPAKNTSKPLFFAGLPVILRVDYIFNINKNRVIDFQTPLMKLPSQSLTVRPLKSYLPTQ